MKDLIGTLTVILSLVGLVPYILDTYRKKTVPHLFTWITAVIILVTVFFGQVTSGAGAGAWSTGSTGILVAIVVILALRNKETYRNIKPIDVVFLVAALLSIIPWLITKDPTLSIIFAVATDIFSLIPTIRKTIKYPDSETLFTYEVNIVRHIFSLLALSTLSIATALFPIYLIGANLVITLVIVKGRVGKHKLKQ